MNKPTTEELKAILAKSSRGPWLASPDGVTAGVTDVLSCDGEYVICEHAGVDATLIALAPTLAAEVVALREALEWAVSSQPSDDSCCAWVHEARQALSQK